MGGRASYGGSGKETTLLSKRVPTTATLELDRVHCHPTCRLPYSGRPPAFLRRGSVNLTHHSNP
jgi:hypothetical protein